VKYAVNLTSFNNNIPYRHLRAFPVQRAFLHSGNSLSPHHPLLHQSFALAPIYRRSECGKALQMGTLAMQATSKMFVKTVVLLNCWKATIYISYRFWRGEKSVYNSYIRKIDNASVFIRFVCVVFFLLVT